MISAIRRRRMLLAVLTLLIYPTLSTRVQAQTRSAGLLNFSSDGTRIACTNRDSGTVTILTWPELKIVHEVPVGLHPEGVAWLGQTRTIAVCVYGDDVIAFVDTETGTVSQRLNVFDEPYGIVSDHEGRHVYATLEYPGQLLRISRQSSGEYAIDGEWPVGAFPRGLAMTRDGTLALVTEYLTATLIEVSTADGRIVREWPGASTDNLARQVVLSPDERKAYFTNVRSRVTAAHGNGSIFPNVTVARRDGEKTGTRHRVPMDTIRGTRVTANPWDCDMSPDGTTLAVVFAGTNDLYFCRVTGDDYVELDYQAGLRLGNNPRAVRFSPDGTQLVVYNALDFDVAAYSVASGAETNRVTVTQNPLTDELLLGKQLFYSALQPMSERNWISCASCHPDGDADGRTWQQPEGLRNTQPLAGLGWTHPLHWSADRDEVQDFEHTIQGKLMQGRGLLRGDLSPALEKPLSGRSRELDALAAYTNSHTFSLSPYAKHGLSDAAQRGRDVFLSADTHCATCHSGPLYCDSVPGDVSAFRRHDVGTGGDDPGELMGPAYDTPTLLGVYRSAPYLHHGKAATLMDVLTTQNAGDRHGRTSHLTDQQKRDLVEFLKALPYEDPEAAAEAAGWTRIIK